MPMRSISANGPIGKPASTSAASIVSIVPAPARRSRSGSSVNGRFTRFTMNPGESATRIAVLPQPSTMLAAALDRPRGGSPPGHDLDERQQRRGVEEVQPDDPLRAAVASAIDVTERALVFVARIVSGAAVSSSPRTAPAWRRGPRARPR